MPVEKGKDRHYLIEEISTEYFIQEHYFVYVIKGIVVLYDGCNYLELRAGDGCIARKNRLGRYYKVKENNELDKIIYPLDEAFLKRFQEKHKPKIAGRRSKETFIQLHKNELLPPYSQSLAPYYSHGQITEAFAELKREELLIILLQSQPELAGVLFDYGIPEKINLEEYMNRNYKFNVSVERFAFLTGRSLSAFKRDFKQIFNETPSHWLVLKRLQEAHFLIEKESKKPSDIYYDLGFETLSHFSFAFKKKFGLTPTALAERSI